jgi:hypothetical protein
MSSTMAAATAKRNLFRRDRFAMDPSPTAPPQLHSPLPYLSAALYTRAIKGMRP